jgi:hypothetical protein
LTISNGTLNAVSSNAFFWLNGSFFSGDDQDILKEEGKTYLTAQSSPLNSTIYLFHLHIYSLCLCGSHPAVSFPFLV